MLRKPPQRVRKGWDNNEVDFGVISFKDVRWMKMP
jgi:hypothetical protein